MILFIYENLAVDSTDAIIKKYYPKSKRTVEEKRKKTASPCGEAAVHIRRRGRP
jgi:hypothetical protein